MNVKKAMSQMIAGVGNNAAKKDAAQAYLMLIYQPKMPKALKKSKK